MLERGLRLVNHGDDDELRLIPNHAQRGRNLLALPPNRLAEPGFRQSPDGLLRPCIRRSRDFPKVGEYYA